MSVLKLLAASGEKRYSPTGNAIMDMLNRRYFSDTDVAVTWDSALQNFAVWASAHLIADLVGHLPMDRYRKRRGSKTPELLDDHPLAVHPLGESDPLEGTEFRRQLIFSALMSGSGVAPVLTRDSLGFAQTMETVHPSDLRVREDGKLPRLRVWFNGMELAPTEYLYVPAFLNPGSKIGLSPVAYAGLTVGLAALARDFGADFFKSGSTPSGILTNDADLNDEDGSKAKTVKERFLAAVEGREPAVLSGGWEYSTIGIKANESQFLETIKADGAMITAFFGLQPQDIGLPGGDSLTYANVQQRNVQRLVYPLGQWMQRLEQRMSWFLPRGQYFKVNPNALLRTDTLTRYKAHQLALSSAWRSVNEVRELEEEAGIGPEGDVYQWRGNTGSGSSTDDNEGRDETSGSSQPS